MNSEHQTETNQIDLKLDISDELKKAAENAGPCPDDTDGKYAWAYSSSAHAKLIGQGESNSPKPLLQKEIEAAKKRYEEHQGRIFSMNAFIAMNQAVMKKKGFKRGRTY